MRQKCWEHYRILIRKDIFIYYFPFARYYKIDMLLVNMAREHKGRICVVTDSLMAPMVQYADIATLVGNLP